MEHLFQAVQVIEFPDFSRPKVMQNSTSQGLSRPHGNQLLTTLFQNNAKSSTITSFRMQ